MIRRHVRRALLGALLLGAAAALFVCFVVIPSAKYADAKKEGGEILDAFERECLYTDIFNLCFNEPRLCGEDKTQKIITG